MNCVYQWTYAAKHALSFSLMYDEGSKFDKYFVFLTFAPGISGENGNTFNFKNSVKFKLTLSKLQEFVRALQLYARKQQSLIGTFGLFADSSKSSFSNTNEKKFMFMNYVENMSKDGSKPTPGVGLVFKTSTQNDGLSIIIPSVAALSIADVCEKIFNYGIDLSMKDFQPMEFKSQNTNSHHSSNNTYKEQPHNNFGSENNIEIDDMPW